MGKKQKQKKNIAEITSGISEKCQISAEPSQPETGITLLDDQINPELLAMWPKLKLKVPPIFLHKPVNFEQHVRKTINLGIKFYQPHLGKNFTRIVCQTFNDHKYLTQYLDKKQLPYHTFGNPSKRKMRVVFRGLPSDIDLNLIKAELKKFSIPIIRLHKMQTGNERRDNTVLTLAVVPYDDDGKVILKITQLLGHKVKLEPPNKKPRQCYRCQKWGHSQRYCHGVIKCVKCAGDHLTKKCEKGPEGEPKCANCSEPHTASYRKCIVAPECKDNQIMLSHKIVHFYKPHEVVTKDNYHMLYKNVDYNKRPY